MDIGMFLQKRDLSGVIRIVLQCPEDHFSISDSGAERSVARAADSIREPRCWETREGREQFLVGGEQVRARGVPMPLVNGARLGPITLSRQRGVLALEAIRYLARPAGQVQHDLPRGSAIPRAGERPGRPGRFLQGQFQAKDHATVFPRGLPEKGRRFESSSSTLTVYSARRLESLGRCDISRDTGGASCSLAFCSEFSYRSFSSPPVLLPNASNLVLAGGTIVERHWYPRRSSRRRDLRGDDRSRRRSLLTPAPTSVSMCRVSWSRPGSSTSIATPPKRSRKKTSASTRESFAWGSRPSSAGPTEGSSPRGFESCSETTSGKVSEPTRPSTWATTGFDSRS